MDQPLNGYHLLEYFRHFQKLDLKTLTADLSSAEFIMLGAIEHRKQPGPGGVDATSVADLVAGSPVSPQAVSKMLNSLEEKGWIHRLSDQHDRRSIRVKLTTEGAECYLAAEQRVTDFLTRVRQAMGEDDLVQMVTLMEKFNRIAKQELPTGQSPSPLQTGIQAGDIDTESSPRTDTGDPSLS